MVIITAAALGLAVVVFVTAHSMSPERNRNGVSRSLRRPSQIRQLSEERNTVIRSANAVARILRHGEFILILLVRRLVLSSEVGRRIVKRGSPSRHGRYV